MATPTAQPASQVIADALIASNIIREGQTPTAEMQARCIRHLNQMMALWESEGKALGYIPVGTVTQTLTVPDGALLGIVNNLAIMIAPSFGASVSAEVVAMAQRGLAAIEKMTAKEVLMQLDLPSSADDFGAFSIDSG